VHRVYNDRIILWSLCIISLSILASIIFGASILALSYYTYYINYNDIISSNPTHTPIEIMMTLLYVSSFILSLTLILSIAWLVIDTLYSTIKGKYYDTK